MKGKLILNIYDVAISTPKVLLVPYDAHHVGRYHAWMQDDVSFFFSLSLLIFVSFVVFPFDLVFPYFTGDLFTYLFIYCVSRNYAKLRPRTSLVSKRNTRIRFRGGRRWIN